MQLDSNLIFAWEQAVTAAAASAQYTTAAPYAAGVVDASIARNLGAGAHKLYLVVLCTAAMTDAGSDSTVTPSLRTSATITGSMGSTPALSGSPATILTGTAFAALSAAGTMQVYVLPPSNSYLEYLDVYFTVANGSLSTGAFSAFITTDVDMQYSYAEGFNPN